MAEEQEQAQEPGRWLRFRARVKSVRRRIGEQFQSLPQVVRWGVLPPTIIIVLDRGVSCFVEEFHFVTHLGGWISANSAISPIVSLYGFFLASAGLVLAGKRTQAVLSQNDIADQGQVTERYTRAVEQLGHENQAVRVGGLYSLQRIAEESEKDRRPIFQILAGFIRAQAPIEYETSDKGEIQKDENDDSIPKSSEQRSEKIDVETAVKILARSVLEEERVDKDKRVIFDDKLRLVDLSATDLRGLDLANQNLSQFNFENALLSDAKNPVKLDRVNLTEAFLDEANLTKALLSEANLTGASMRRVNLTGVDLSEANLIEANLPWANLTGAHLSEANLTEANLPWANLTRAALGGTNLTGARLSGTNLTEAFLTKANLTRAALGGTNLTGANLQGANLTKVESLGTNLARACLVEVNLTEACLIGGDLTGADLRWANLTGAKLAALSFAGAKNFTQGQLKEIRYKKDMPPVLPEGLIIPKGSDNIIKPGDKDWADDD